MKPELDLYDRGRRDGLRAAIEVCEKHFAKYRVTSDSEAAVEEVWNELEELLAEYRREGSAG